MQRQKTRFVSGYDKDVEAAARFYAETFPDSTMGPSTAPADYPSGKNGAVLTVDRSC
jgi:predicted 3-demethylubiquinone-9 3-methyltransferase (glyoxalase superfamily)